MHHPAKSRSQRNSPVSPRVPVTVRKRDSTFRETSLASTADVSGMSSLLPDFLEQKSSELECLSKAVSQASTLVLGKLRHLKSRSGDVSEEGSASPVPRMRTHHHDNPHTVFFPSPTLHRTSHTRGGSMYATAPLCMDLPHRDSGLPTDLTDLDEK